MSFLQDIVEVFVTDKSYGHNLENESVYGMRLELDKDKYCAEYKSDYPQTHTKGKIKIINTCLKPQHNGKVPILVAGDSSGDTNIIDKV